MFGLLSYQHSYNLGDEIQSIAAQQYLPRTDFLIDRDTSIENPNYDIRDSKHIISNGWFDGNYCQFPYSSNINPLFISFHINETDHSLDSMYSILDNKKIAFKSISSHTHYLKQYQPIGCRDLNTVKILQQQGISAYFSGCLTLTLNNPFTSRNGEILIVDSHILCPTILNSLIPENIRNKAIYITQSLTQITPHHDKMQLAQAFLNRLAQAKLVITSRLHTVLPCVAFNTPVVFIYHDLTDIRFSGLLPFFKHYTTGDKLDIDLELYRNPPKSPELLKLISNLKNNVISWVDTNIIHHNQMHPLNDLIEGNTIISVCMNRHDHLIQTLPTWIATKPQEIIIVDWGSTPPINSIIDQIKCQSDISKQPNIRLVRVNGVSNWVLTYAFNLAFRLTQTTNVLKVDCDSLLNSDFFQYHNLNANTDINSKTIFFTGDWQQARDDNEKHLNGVIYVKRNDFFKIGGYNELITTYGYDDCDLYQRLECVSRRLRLNFNLIQHVPHTNLIRTSLTNQTQSRVDIEIEKNRLISELKLWTPQSLFSTFVETTTNQFQYLSSQQLSDTLRQTCQLKAIKNREYVLKLNPKPKKLYIAVMNGLGNRLRTLASAACVAQACHRQLVIIWIADSHCQAEFSDLFKHNYLVNHAIIISDPKLVQFENINYDWNYDWNHNFEILPTYDQRDGLDIYNYMTGQYQPINLMVDSDILVISASVLQSPQTNWKLESHWLNHLEPTDSILSIIYNFTQNLNFSELIGVHVRMGQDPTIYSYEDFSHYSIQAKKSLIKWRENSHWSTFLQEMDNYIKINPNQQFFLCCDNPNAYEMIANYKDYQSRVIYIKRDHYDRDLQQIKGALIDLILLSKTKILLGSNWSSFTEVAHRLGNQSLRLAGHDF